MERLSDRIKEIPLPCADNALFWSRVHEKLATYEDAEEQGRLVVLPCNVWDAVYMIWPCGKKGKSVCELVIRHIDIDYLPDIEYSVLAKRGSGTYRFFKAADIGKTVFLTLEEAEKALERMK